MKKLIKILPLVIIFLLFGFTEQANLLVSNWYQQFLPNLNGRQINDITFIDSLTGFAVTNNLVQGDTAYVLKTTNGGDNWNIIFRDFRVLHKVIFLNNNTGFVCGGSGTPYLYKTTNSGINWNLASTFGCYSWNDMAVLNDTTIWAIDNESLCGGVFFTSNGGANWTHQLNAGSSNPSKIYMYNQRIGFVTDKNSYTRRTTDGGQTWTVMTSGSGEGFYDMYFWDSLNGLGSFYNVRRTTDGGTTWMPQVLPFGGIILTTGVYQFSKISKDTIWAVGGEAFYGSGQFRGIVYRTTNSGTNWLFQVPDTTIHIGQYLYTQFINTSYGWAYSSARSGVHTTTGGDPVWLTGIEQISSEVPKEFELKQNYPNPFNPRTVIPFSLKKKAYVKIIAYDITGREVQLMVDGMYTAGEYEVDFMGKYTSSGVYFYSLFIDDKFINTKKMILLK